MDDLDLSERMERLSRRVDGAAAPDLHAVRERHVRRRTRSALVVGLTVAVAGTLLAAGALRPAQKTPGEAPASSGDGHPIMLWPEPGNDEPWRTEPRVVAVRFAQRVLGWSAPDVTDTSDAAVPFRTFLVAPDPCSKGDVLGDCPSLAIAVGPYDADIWGIVGVAQPKLTLDVSPRYLLGMEGPIPVELSLPEGRTGHIGLVASNGCREVSAYEIGLATGHFELPVPKPAVDDPLCDDIGSGYVFAYVTDDTTEPVGDPLLEAAAIEYPWLTITPIYLLMEASSSQSDTAESPPANTPS